MVNNNFLVSVYSIVALYQLTRIFLITSCCIQINTRRIPTMCLPFSLSERAGSHIIVNTHTYLISRCRGLRLFNCVRLQGRKEKYYDFPR
jgi:hypothetical protein